MSKPRLQRYLLPSLIGRGLGVGLFLLLAFILGACSSDDDSNGGFSATTVSEAPVWKIDWSNNQERPNWTEPDGTLYENWTILKVQIEEELQPYVSEGDMMALFVNSELRGLASPAVIVGSDQSSYTKYLLKAYGNETGSETVNMSLQYYNQQLNHIFTLSDNISLDSDVSIGIDEDYIPDFTFGSAKYPVTKLVNVEGVLTKAGITPAVGNMVGAFVGTECRGAMMLSDFDGASLIIYGRAAGESVTIKYYDAATCVLYTIPDAVKL